MSICFDGKIYDIIHISDVCFEVVLVQLVLLLTVTAAMSLRVL